MKRAIRKMVGFLLIVILVFASVEMAFAQGNITIEPVAEETTEEATEEKSLGAEIIFNNDDGMTKENVDELPEGISGDTLVMLPMIEGDEPEEAIILDKIEEPENDETEVVILEEEGALGCFVPKQCEPKPCIPKIRRCHPSVIKYIAEKGGHVEPEEEWLYYVCDKPQGSLAVADDGYEFEYWSKAYVCGYKSYRNPFVPCSDECATYKAHFKIIKYTISYEGLEGATCEANPTEYTVESDPITLNNPAKEGFAFTGWIENGTGEPQLNVTIPTGSFGNKVFTASWSEIKPEPEPEPQPEPQPQPEPHHTTGTVAQTAYGWRLVGENLWMYYYDASTYATNWALIDNTWYHFRSNGIMDYGWFYDTDGTWYYLSETHDGSFGSLNYNWHRDATDGRTYFLDLKTGAMHVGEDYIDGKKCFFCDVYTPAWYQGADQRWYYTGQDHITPYGSQIY